MSPLLCRRNARIQSLFLVTALPPQWQIPKRGKRKNNMEGRKAVCLWCCLTCSFSGRERQEAQPCQKGSGWLSGEARLSQPCCSCAAKAATLASYTRHKQKVEEIEEGGRVIGGWVLGCWESFQQPSITSQTNLSSCSPPRL